jgi:DNA modification methylase
MKQQVKISKVKGNPSNPRIIKNDKFKKLVKSIKEFPEMLKLRPIVVDEDFMVLGGNMRLKASKEAGLSEVWIDIAEGLTEEQKKEFIVKDNVGFGEWEWDILANEWDSVQLAEWGLDVWENEDDKVTEGLIDDDEIPEVKESIVKRGDIWQLGEHRVMCGDSTSSDDVAKLMNGEKADMVFTDPPYGIAHSGKGIKGATKENDFGEILGDSDISVAKDCFNLINNLYANCLQIWWGANYYCQSIPNGFGWLVWDKEREGNTFSGAELAFVNKGVKVDVFKHRWHGMIKASEMGEKRIHPTQKPIALAEWCFKNYEAGNLILDIFLGSGSTLIAAEKTKRKCYGMELDEKYCDVIINRWEQFTGLKATIINGTK